MATYDGAFSGRPFTLRLAVTQASQDIALNQSVVNWSLIIISNAGYTSYNGDPSPWSVNINGTPYSGTFSYDFSSVPSGGSILIASGSTTVPHNPNGTKQISSSASANGGYPIGSASCGGTLTLTTIPRASTPTFSASPVDADTSVTITTNRADSSFTHTIEYAIGAASGTIGTGIGASTSWTPPLSLLNQMPNSITGNITITTKTYSGATLIGTTTTTLVLRAPDSVIPDFTTVTHSETVSLVSTEVGAYVQNLTKLALAITGAAGAYGSTITGYKIVVSGQTINAVSGTTPAPIASSGTVTITGTVTDSRNRQKSKTVDITVLAYSPPSITSYQFRRANSSGVVDLEFGNRIRMDLNAAVQSLLVSAVQKNALTYKFFARAKGAGSWGSAVETVTPAGVMFNSYDYWGTYAIEDSSASKARAVSQVLHAFRS